MKKLVMGVLGSMLLALPGLSAAVPMNWTYSGTCSWGNCEDVPSIAGSLWADPQSYGSGNEINEYALFGDLIGYTFTVGEYSFSGTAGLGTYYLDSAGNITGGSMIFANLFALEFLDVGGATWSILDTDCRLFSCRENEAGGSGAYTNTSVSVPEPGTLGLFGLALLGAGLGTRRRKIAK
ncbi:MAG TPA: PEP-CTERM sorting domain-containing protein [Povalibacter sp.]|uniref:PEP-CTERM sorting domain-containing protein n=1 Tax=Povalibacter sp. TaxID=1962978 RepID=UPI002C2B39BF|nr:PEP-CTERM sorting domain-containing protein [Povalibacter sp.]HMN42997.1 PEP-CTERM sorting domain-containing protein [Povalibacter sp.]